MSRESLSARLALAILRRSSSFLALIGLLFCAELVPAFAALADSDGFLTDMDGSDNYRLGIAQFTTHKAILRRG
jgi:hypothetical protein